MTIQEHIVQVTQEAAEEFFRYAAAVPADKLEWEPLETGQSALSMCREIAVTPDWAIAAMTGKEYTQEEREASFAEMQSWNTVEECHQQFQARFPAWAEYIKTFPESEFQETRWLPYNGGRDHTYLEMFEYPRWNTTYHLGQISYIQTLYGDKEMY